MMNAPLILTSSGLDLNETRIEGPIWLSENDISLIKTQISDAESHLQNPELQKPDLARQRDAELEKIATLRNILSPIRRIPAETLSEIFEHVSFGSRLRYESECAVNLSSVCVAWRNGAHRTPSLWATIVYQARWGTFDHQSERVRTCLSRSGGLLLRLDIDMWGEHTIATVNSCAQFFQFLHPFLPRISYLSLCGRLSFCLPLLHLPSGSMPLLKWLNIYVRRTDDCMAEDQFPRGLAVFSGSPLLETVALFEGSGERCSLLENLVLDDAQSLNSLSLDLGDNRTSMNPHIYLLVIARLTNLVTLCLDFCSAQPHIPNHTETILLDLPHLTSIQISLCWEMHLPHVLHIVKGLIAPRLTSLSLQLEEAWETSDLVEALQAFRARSRVSLFHLELSGFGVYEDLHAIIDIFTPNIDTLHVLRMWFNPVLLLRALTHRKGEDVLLPKLRDVRLRLIDLEDESDEDALRPGVTSVAVVDMIESRWWNGKKDRRSEDRKRDGAKPMTPARWKTVLVDMDRLLFPEEAHRRVGVCKEQGLDVSVVNDEQSPILREDEWEEEEP